MKSFTSQRVVKSCAVEVAAPRVLDCQIEAFQRLASHLAVLKIEEELNFPSKEAELQGDFKSDYQSAFRSESVLQAQVQAETIIAQAYSEAAQIRREAEQKAAGLLSKAQAEEESYRLQLAAAVRAEVLPRAKQEGYEEGVRLGREEAETMRAEAGNLFNLAQKALAQEYVKAEEDILHLSILIAERLVRAVISVDPSHLAAIVKTLSVFPQERQGWRLHFSAQDKDCVERLEPGVLPCPWVVDESLDRGDCRLESQEGVFDARISTQLDRLEEILREELRRGSMAETGTDRKEY